VTGMMVINFWRPILNYTRENPLLTKPLAVAEPSSIKTADTVHTALESSKFGGTGAVTDQMALRHNEGHKWYYYPRMINDEVLVFKQFEYWKTDNPDRTQIPVRGCFHTAFVDPNTPVNAPERTSSEYRVVVYIGKEKSAKELEAKDQWVPPTSLFPKANEEWGGLILSFGIVGLLAQAFGDCPTIPDATAFLLCFSCATIPSNIIKFYFSLDRPNHKGHYPLPSGIADFLGILQLAFGIWGITLLAPNLDLLGDASPETCELAVLVAMAIPCAIIAIVIVGLLGVGVYKITCAPST
jgi:hypothetical protein